MKVKRWIVEYGAFIELAFDSDYNMMQGLGPYSASGARWRDSLTDLADPEGHYTKDTEGWKLDLPEDLFYRKRTPEFDTKA